MKILVTGSSGLIGSEVAIYFAEKGFKIIGIDNNQRKEFFGPNGDTKWNTLRLFNEINGFVHYSVDIRSRIEINNIIKEENPDVIIHTAAQPSHDRAADIPFDDFDTNAVGTLNLLEAARKNCPNTIFVHMSTNKVYGDAPNNLRLLESETRWEFADSEFANGISENFTIDQSKHSLFGASKLSADILVQEYGRYFNMSTCCLRGGCLTGPNHSGVELHGFLSYLVKCNLEQKNYTIYGYKGKQVRDNINAYDVATFIDSFISKPRIAEVYNLGGGKDNSISIIEAFSLVEKITGKPQQFIYQSENRKGDHICYYSDLTKIKSHYPDWAISKDIETTVREIVEGWNKRGIN